MPITRINYGASPDDGTGDPLRTAFRKTDDNFNDLEARKAEEQDVADALARKQDAQAGMGLSQNSYTTAERTKLAGIAAGAQVNVATNLGIGTRTATVLPVTSSTGNAANLPVATTTQAGVMSAADKVSLNGAETPAGALARIRGFGLGVSQAGGVGSSLMPSNPSNLSATVLISSGAAIPIADSHAPVQGQEFGGASISRELRPSQFGVSGRGAAASFWFRGYTSALSTPSDWRRVVDVDMVGYTSSPTVPTTFQGAQIVVTTPHMRQMVWDGVKYIRAPWHQPCQLFFSYDNPATIPGALPVRADSTWQQSQFPDVVARLGLSGAGTFSLVEARGEGLRVLDNGRGVDTGRVLRSAQGDAGRNLTGAFSANSYAGEATGSFYKSASGGPTSDGGTGAYNLETSFDLDASRQWPTANEFRMRNIAFPLWMTI